MRNEKTIPAIECIIFNCDTVLLNIETIIISALLDKAEEYGLNIELDEAIWLFSEKGTDQNIIYLKSLFGANVPDNFEEELRKKIAEELRYGIAPKEGVNEMMQQLKKPLCIVTNASRESIERNLEVTNLFKFFASGQIFAICEMVSWNSDTELYLHIASNMGYKPEQCVIIVDSIAGINDRIKDGFNVYAITNGFNKKEMEDIGAVVFEEIKDLPKLLPIV